MFAAKILLNIFFGTKNITNKKEAIYILDNLFLFIPIKKLNG
jgi:hypothetical protein